MNKSLYGFCQAPRNFFNFISEKLDKAGLKPCTEVDPCLFMSDKVIVLVYMHDTLFFRSKKEWIMDVLKKLEKDKVALEEEEDVAGFLGVHMERNPQEGTIHLTQKGLIDRIIAAMKIGHLQSVDTPTAESALPSNKDGPPASGTFNYASVIGMLQYL